MKKDNNPIEEMYSKYAELLTNYCLEVESGSRVMIRSTYLAEPLLIELCKSIAKAGGIPFLDISIKDQSKTIINNSDLSQLSYVNPLELTWVRDFEGYLYIKSDFEYPSNEKTDPEKQLAYNKSNAQFREIYNKRTGERSLKRSLCLYPTLKNAEIAGMEVMEYRDFVFNACKLYEDNPTEAWRTFGKNQQKVVDYLNSRTSFKFVGSNIDMTFNTKGRIWINSDGKTNMPSGEVYTSPTDDSMNGWVKYTVPTIYENEEVDGIELQVVNGEVVSHTAKTGKDHLDMILSRDGAKKFGEAAIGTNYNIQRVTKNILFDEKIGGTVHFALGQAYKQCNGTNESTVHWDMITDMSDGEIYADDELCYKNGKFIID